MRFSVIIPAYNGAAFLPRSLAALAASTDRDFELLVIDDGSTDASAKIARAAGATVLSLPIRGGPARARNRGAREAAGEILVFFDADVCVHADTLARIDAYLRQHPETVAVMGSYDDQPSEPSFVSQYRNLFHHLIHQSSASHASTFWAGCGAIRREVFVASGGFDESYSRPCIEDIELGARLAAAGHRLALEPTIQVTHLKRWTLASVVRTDLFDRAAPWIALMLRQGSMPADLNVTAVHRVSVVLAWLLLFGTVALIAAASTASAAALWAVLSMWVPIATALLLLNFEVYRFFAAKRGLWFAIRSVAMHWLYYFYCGLGVILGVWQYLRAPVTLPASRQQVS